MHLIIQTLKSSASNPLGRKFNKIAYVGHSYGSFLGAAQARQYPSDIDALVLTGYSTSLAFSALAGIQFTSAANLFPARYPTLPLGYLTLAKESDREGAFYGGWYDHAIPQVDWTFEDTLTDGEVAGLAFILQPSVGYTNPILLVTGVEDAIFCTPPLSTCRATLDASRAFFPNSTNFQYEAIPETGHDLQLHYSAPVSVARVHAFLGQVL